MRQTLSQRLTLCPVIAAIATFLVPPAVSAEPADVASFYKGNTIKIVVGFGPGGGIDIYSRILARHMGANIPGNPSIIVTNLPGAGSMKAVQSLDVSPKDGTTIVAFNPGNITVSLMDPAQVNFRFDQLGYLGSLSAETQVCYMRRDTGIDSFDAFVRQPKIAMGATSHTDSEYILGALLRNLFGVKIQHVAGYRSKPEINIAIERGELDGGCGSFDGIPKDWVANKKLNMIVRLTEASPPGVPEMPNIMQFANAEQKTVLNAVLAINDMFRPYIVAKDIPAERLSALREAFYRTVTGKPFLDEAQKLERTVQNQLRGEDVDRIVDGILKVSPQTIAKMREAVR